MTDLLKSAVKNLRRRRLRTFLTICSIAIGLTAVVLIFTISGYGKMALNQELESMGLGGIMVSRDPFSNDAKMDRTTELSVIQQMEGVEEAVPVVAEYSKLVLRNLITETIIWGIDQGEGQMISLKLLFGRLLQNPDVAQCQKVCIVDEALAQKIYKRSNIVGKTIRLELQNQYEEFEIIGVVASGGNLLQNVLSGYIPYFVYIPYTTLQQMTGNQDFNQIAITLKDDYEANQQGDRIVETLNRLDGSQCYRFDNISTQTDKLKNMMDILSFVLAVIAAISLLVAGIGIMTVMLVSVSERTKEIGIKKAIGASRKMILKEFLAESFTISLCGGIIGILSGLMLSFIISFLLGVPLILEWNSYGISFLFTVGIGVIFGLYPAIRASALRPVEALKVE